VFFFFFSAVSQSCVCLKSAGTFGGKMWLKKGEKKREKKSILVDAKGRPRAQEKRAKPTLCLIKNYYIYNIFT
jgi:hypothetical protein